NGRRTRIRRASAAAAWEADAARTDSRLEARTAADYSAEFASAIHAIAASVFEAFLSPASPTRSDDTEERHAFRGSAAAEFGSTGAVVFSTARSQKRLGRRNRPNRCKGQGRVPGGSSERKLARVYGRDRIGHRAG